MDCSGSDLDGAFCIIGRVRADDGAKRHAARDAAGRDSAERPADNAR